VGALLTNPNLPALNGLGTNLLVTSLLRYIEYVNVLLGLFNLLPVFPLDGGQVMRDVMTGLAPENGLQMSLGLSFLIAGIIAAGGVMARLMLLQPRGGALMKRQHPRIESQFEEIAHVAKRALGRSDEMFVADLEIEP
jgi:Zn-dependent protease